MKDAEQMYYLDFDKLFEEYADKYYFEHEDDYESPDEFAADLDKVYREWAKTPQPELKGLSPREFFDSIPASKLIDILKGACAGDSEPSSLLFDRIAAEPELFGELINLATTATDEKLLHVTLSLISALGGADARFYADMIDRDIDAEVKEHCVEALCDRAEEARELLLERAAAADSVGKLELYADPLTLCAPGDDRILALLRTLLAKEPNIAYIAALMGRYGDERACSDLYKLLDTCDYAQFLEIRNAIEELGGTVDAHYRDFSDDPTYIALKRKRK